MNILNLSGLRKTYKTEAEELVILKDINLEVEVNSTCVITGESGCGKSTLLNIIGGLDRADSGEIYAGGYNLNSMSESSLSEYRIKKVGFIFQFHYLLKDFTCLENVMMPFYMAGSSKKSAVERAESMLERVNLHGRNKHYPAQLSGGERQRAALARALINNPEMILADEPTGNLDEENSRIVEALLFDMVRTEGKTLLMVTHDNELALRGDREYLLTKGELQPI